LLIGALGLLNESLAVRLALWTGVAQRSRSWLAGVSILPADVGEPGRRQSLPV
jgi:hypothetical protein